MSDLIERLRKERRLYDAEFGLNYRFFRYLSLCDEAADEIEHLTADRDHWRGRALAWAERAGTADVKRLQLQARVEALEGALRIFDPGMNSLDSLAATEQEK